MRRRKQSNSNERRQEALSNKQPHKRNNFDVNHPIITKKQTRQPQTGSRESVPLSKNSD